MKILHVLTSPRAEGTPKLVLDWLTVAEYEQEVLFLTPNGELKDQFETTEKHLIFNSRFSPKFKNPHKIIGLVNQFCKERKPDVVIAWMMGFSQWVHLGARLAGVKKLIVHAGNPPGTSFMGKYVFTYLSFTTGQLLGNRVICCSNYIRDAYRAIPLLSQNQFQAVPNCFKSDRFLHQHEIKQPQSAIMVATLERHKDHKTLLHAWKMVEKELPSATLQLAGNGSLKTELCKLAVDLKLKNVMFLGSRNDVPELLKTTELFVFSTTRAEGFGTVLLEALAAGCKVIAADVPACREVLKNGEYGQLVTAADSIQLAEAIVTQLTTSANKDEVERNIAYAKQFSPEQMIKQYLSLLG